MEHNDDYWIIQHQQREHYPFGIGVKVLACLEGTQRESLYYCEVIGKGTAVVVSYLHGECVTKEQAFVHNTLYVK